MELAAYRAPISLPLDYVPSLWSAMSSCWCKSGGGPGCSLGSRDRTPRDTPVCLTSVMLGIQPCWASHWCSSNLCHQP